MNKVCGECANYSSNIRGSWAARLCQKDMMDDDCQKWFERRDPMDECHRPDDFQEVSDFLGGMSVNRNS